MRSRVPVSAYRLERVEIDGERAAVELRIEVMALRGGAGSTLMEENWVLRPDGWFRVYVPTYTPFDKRSR